MQENTSNATTPPTAKQETKGWFAKNKVAIILVIVLILANVGIYFYQQHQQNKLKEAFAKELQERADITAELIERRNEHFLDAMGRSLANSVQAEMIRGNMEQLNQFLVETVQETDIQMVSVIDSLGMIVLSTDKKFEGQPFSKSDSKTSLNIRNPQVLESSTEKAAYITPVMAIDYRIATMVLEYQIDDETKATLKRLRNTEVSTKAK